MKERKEIERLIDIGYIDKTKHPSEELWILNYTKQCQYEGMWTPETKMCRGLIIDSDWNIVARGFRKFFNYEEIQDKSEIPVGEPFEITEKLDGSLGILYWVSGTPYIATRGRFDSDQALHATEILHTKYRDSWDKLDQSKTYLFEIIYPENQIIVRYGDLDDIFLLAVIDTQTEEEESIEEWETIFHCTISYKNIPDYLRIREIEEDTGNREGFVIHFLKSGYRVKLKFPNYFAMSSLKQQITKKKVLEILTEKAEDEWDQKVLILPEECQIQYRGYKKEIMEEYKEIQDKVSQDVSLLPPSLESQKDKWEWLVENSEYPGLVMAYLKGANIEKSIWKTVRRTL